MDFEKSVQLVRGSLIICTEETSYKIHILTDLLGGKEAWRPLFIIPGFFCIFTMNFAMATLGLKEMGKFLWEGREKSCSVGCLSLVLLN